MYLNWPENVLLMVLSDLHLEGYPPHIIDNKTKEIVKKIQFEKKKNKKVIVVLAGDIGEGVAGAKWAKNLPTEVIYICGNHEFYNQDYTENIKHIRSECRFSNVAFLYNEEITLHGIRFLGATLWSDMAIDRKDRAFDYSTVIMNDFNFIRDKNLWDNPQLYKDLLKKWQNKKYQEQDLTFKNIPWSAVYKQYDEDLDWFYQKAQKDKLFTPARELIENEKSKKFLIEKLRDKSVPTVVVTHHLPFRQTIDNYSDTIIKEQYSDDEFVDAIRGRIDNSFLKSFPYMNDLWKDLAKVDAINSVFWCHGHWHGRANLGLGPIRIISNALGGIVNYKDNIESVELRNPVKYNLNEFYFSTHEISNTFFEKIEEQKAAIQEMNKLFHKQITKNKILVTLLNSWNKACIEIYDEMRENLQNLNILFNETIYHSKLPEEFKIYFDQELHHMQINIEENNINSFFTDDEEIDSDFPDINFGAVIKNIEYSEEQLENWKKLIDEKIQGLFAYIDNKTLAEY